LEIIGVIVFFVIIIGYFYLTKKTSPKNQPITTKETISPSPLPSPTPKLYGSEFNLKTVSSNLNQPLAKNLNIIMAIDSKGKQVVGYDAVVKYDNQALKFLNLTSLIPDIKIFKFPKKGLIVITGTKSLSSKKQLVFNNQDVLQLTFQPLVKSKTKVEIVDVSNKDKSQIVDNNSTSSLAKPSSLTIEIE